MVRFARHTVLALTLALAAGAAWADDAAPALQTAKWVSRDLNFTFIGFTSTYSCDGLQTEVEEILETLGARKQDIKVRITPCVGLGTSEISVAPGVRGTISVLVPASAEDAARGGPDVVPAHWQPVNVMKNEKLLRDRGGQCELLEQSKRGLLPLFTTRNLDYSSNCLPHQTFSVGMTFKVDVLLPDPKP
jgi:hypothetical protein